MKFESNSCIVLYQLLVVPADVESVHVKSGRDCNLEFDLASFNLEAGCGVLIGYVVCYYNPACCPVSESGVSSSRVSKWVLHV